MQKMYSYFEKLLFDYLKIYFDRKIIIYGYKTGEFVYWWLQKNNVNVAYIIDRWNIDQYYHINHLMTLYYLDDTNYVIINTLPKHLGPQPSFKEIGEDWGKSVAKDIPIVELWEYLYADLINAQDDNYPSISYFDFLEVKMNLDIINTIQRKHVSGIGAHGYYPTDIRILDQVFNTYIKNDEPVFDFGCGKGAVLSYLCDIGYRKVGGGRINRKYLRDC